MLPVMMYLLAFHTNDDLKIMYVEEEAKMMADQLQQKFKIQHSLINFNSKQK